MNHLQTISNTNSTAYCKLKKSREVLFDMEQTNKYIQEDEIFECYQHLVANGEDVRKMRWCHSSRELEYAVQHYLFTGNIKKALWIEDIRAYNHKFGSISDLQALSQKFFLKRLIFWILRSNIRFRQIFPKDIVKIIIEDVVAPLKVPYHHSIFWDSRYSDCRNLFIEKCCKHILNIALLQRSFPMFWNGLGNRIYDMWFEILFHPWSDSTYRSKHNYTKKQKEVIKQLLEDRSEFFNTHALMNSNCIPLSFNILSHLRWWPKYEVFETVFKKQEKQKKNASKRQRKIIKKNRQKHVKTFNNIKDKRPICKKEKRCFLH